MACSVTSPVVIDPLAIDVTAHCTLNLAITTTNLDTLIFSVEVGYSSAGVVARKTILVRKPLPGLLKVATTIDLPVGSIIEFVQIEEFSRTNSAGYVQ